MLLASTNAATFEALDDFKEAVHPPDPRIPPLKGDRKGYFAADIDKLSGWRKKVNQVVTGKSAISADFAIDLGEALGTSAQMWTRMQSDYDLFIALKKRKPA